jgi:hypothetical protein
MIRPEVLSKFVLGRIPEFLLGIQIGSYPSLKKCLKESINLLKPRGKFTYDKV